MKLGDFRFAMCEDMSITVWKDRGSKPVLIISNMHNPRNETIVKRTNKEGKKKLFVVLIQCLIIILKWVELITLINF
jgi:hypothetical protein